MKLLFLGLLGLLGTAPYSPRVETLFPAGGQRGTEVEVQITGQRLFEPQGILCTRPGLEVVDVRSGDARRCKVLLRIAPDCPLGAHGLRLRTAHGLANIALFHVGVLPEVVRAGGNQAQPLPANTTVNGQLEEGDTDRFTIELAEGMHVRCEVEAFRLGFAATDLALGVTDAAGHFLAESDDSTLGHKDPILSFVAPASGSYELALRPAFAHPQNRGPYRLHVGTFPRPRLALPCGGAPGQTLTVTLLGDGDPVATTVTLPQEPADAWPWFPTLDHGGAPSPVLMRVGGPPNVEPLPGADGRRSLTIPGSVHGVVGADNAPQRFFFRADKGEELIFRIVARGIRSPLDPLLVLRRADGRYLSANDDQGGLGLDSLVRFRAPDAGEYQVEVRDVLRRGSPEHVFRLEVDRPAGSAPGVRLVVGRREDASIVVPQGGRMGGVLQVAAAEGGGLALLALDLPRGVGARFGPLAQRNGPVPFVLAAAPDAPLGDARVRFAVRADTEPTERALPFEQDVPLVTVRNDQAILGCTERALPVAVTEAMPIALEVKTPQVPLVRGGPFQLAVDVRRQEGNRDRVRLRVLWAPPGIGAGQAVIEPQSQTAQIALSANANAALGTFPIAVVATIDARGGRLETCSDFVQLTVEEPWLRGTPASARTEQGVDAPLRIELQASRAIARETKARLLGLPRGVRADDLVLAPGAQAAEFLLHVARDAACGRHRNVQLELAVGTETGEVVCRSPCGELRIDTPLKGTNGGQR